jgi:hypothetical protein
MLRTIPILAFCLFLSLLFGDCAISIGGQATPGKLIAAKAPVINLNSTATQIGAYITYYRAHGYTITTNQQSYKPDGEVNVFRFAATHRRKSSHEDATANINAVASRMVITISSNIINPQSSNVTHRAKPPTKATIQVPDISLTSTAKQIGAYVIFYQEHGYTVTINQQSYRPGGKVRTFRFSATRRSKSGHDGASANINAATQIVITRANGFSDVTYQYHTKSSQ